MCGRRQTAHAKVRVAAQNRPVPTRARPIAEAVPLLPPLALAHNRWVDAEAGVVDEDAAVDLGGVHARDAPGEQSARGLFEVEREAEVFGEVVERAEREHAERLVRVDEQGGDRADRAVAAAGQTTRQA